MKKAKKRAQTVEIMPGGATDAPEIAEDTAEDTEPGAPKAAEASERADDGAADLQIPEETTPVALLGSDGVLIASRDVFDDESWDGPTREGESPEVAALIEASRVAASAFSAEQSEGAFENVVENAGEGAEAVPVAVDGGVETTAPDETPAVDSAGRLESILESLLFASDRALTLSDLKRLVSERDGKIIGAALERLQERHRESGIQLASVGGGWQFRTHPENALWVSKLIAGRPARLSRAMLETLAIVAYRQPITRPEIDEIRGVDCGPVLKTLLDRVLVRMIGKKEEVGRPILYGTTPEFLRTFSLRDLTELPTLREFHELGLAEQAKVDAETPREAGAGDTPAADTSIPRAMPAPTELPDLDPDEEDALLAELDDATSAAARATTPPAQGEATESNQTNESNQPNQPGQSPPASGAPGAPTPEAVE